MEPSAVGGVAEDTIGARAPTGLAESRLGALRIVRVTPEPIFDRIVQAVAGRQDGPSGLLFVGQPLGQRLTVDRPIERCPDPGIEIRRLDLNR